MISDDSPVAEDALWELERQFWLRAGDVDFYGRSLTDDAVMVFPAPFGVIDRTAILDAIASSTGWASVSIDERRLVTLNESSVALAYRATGVRAGQPDYATYAASVYVRRDGDWKLALHQQTPIGQSPG